MVERAREQAYRDKQANSTFTGFDYEKLSQSEINSVNSAYNIESLPQVIIMRDGDVIGRIRDGHITEQAIYESIIKGVPGEGENKPVVQPGSDGLLPLLNLQGLQNLLSKLLKELLSDPKKLIILAIIIYAITQKKGRRRRR